MARRLSPSHSSPPSAPRDQVFEVVCGCGETLTGSRQPQAQTLSCPQCGTPLFILPADCYAGAAPPRKRSAPLAGVPSGGLVDKLNRLAFWTRVRERRTTVGGQICSAARHMGRWVKRRLTSLRLWML